MIFDIPASILLVLSWVFIVFGMIAIFKVKNLYTRILSAATIDTVASLTIILALLIANILDFNTVIRFILLIAFLLITNPISSHVNIRSAYLTGVDIKKLEREEERRAREEEERTLYG